jgi:Tol biopolymer transport system component
MKWIAYASDESGRMEVYAQPLPPAAGIPQVLFPVGGIALGTRHLYSVTPDGLGDSFEAQQILLGGHAQRAGPIAASARLART